MMYFELTFAVNYNGVYCTQINNHNPEEKVQKVLDQISDTFPEYTYEWCKDLGPWDEILLTEEQEQELIEKATHMLHEVLDVDYNVVFRYDTISS